MTKARQLKRVTLWIGGGLVLLWIVYSVLFQRFYQDIVLFSTSEAHPLVRILELIDYRGKELLPYLTIFFTLTALSSLCCLSLFFLERNKQENYSLVIVFSAIFSLMIIYNVANRLALLLVLLVLVSLITMYSLVVTFNYLYLDKTHYEAGDVVHTEGPFESETQASDYSLTMLMKRQPDLNADELMLASDIYQDESNHYYVDIYVEYSRGDNK